MLKMHLRDKFLIKGLLKIDLEEATNKIIPIKGNLAATREVLIATTEQWSVNFMSKVKRVLMRLDAHLLTVKLKLERIRTLGCSRCHIWCSHNMEVCKTWCTNNKWLTLQRWVNSRIPCSLVATESQISHLSKTPTNQLLIFSNKFFQISSINKYNSSSLYLQVKQE